MSTGIVTTAYLVAGVLFILSIGGLSKQETAQRGNVFGIVGMLLAVVATLLGGRIEGYASLGAATIVGAAIGAMVASRVAMTAMPQLVALLHSFVGAAAVLVGIATLVGDAPPGDASKAEAVIRSTEMALGVFI